MATAIVLGSGTSSGVPVLGVKYSEAFLKNSRNWRTRSSLAIESQGAHFLVDCGPDMRIQLLREGVTSVEGVLITHTHADHIMGMDDLRAFCLKSGRSMPIFAYPEHQEDIKRIFGYAFQEFPDGIEVPKFVLHDVPNQLEFRGLCLQTAVTYHGSVRVTGIRVGNFAYLTDCKSLPPESEFLVGDLETLVVSCVRLKPHRNHMNREEALAFVEKWKPQRTYFTHLSHDFDANDTDWPDGVQLAWDGLRIEL